MTRVGILAAAAILVCGLVLSASRVSAEDAKAKPVDYKGEFSDASGHKGPMSCKLTPGEAGKWNLAINAENKGTGPNKTQDFKFDLDGKKEGEVLKLSGKPEAGRMTGYEMTVDVTDKAFDAKFKSAKNSGTITLKAAQ